MTKAVDGIIGQVRPRRMFDQFEPFLFIFKSCRILVAVVYTWFLCFVGIIGSSLWYEYTCFFMHVYCVGVVLCSFTL
jgi:hypothetical protein